MKKHEKIVNPKNSNRSLQDNMMNEQGEVYVSAGPNVLPKNLGVCDLYFMVK